MSKKTTNNTNRKAAVLYLVEAESSLRTLARGLGETAIKQEEANEKRSFDGFIATELADEIHEALRRLFVAYTGRLPELDRQGDLITDDRETPASSFIDDKTTQS